MEKITVISDFDRHHNAIFRIEELDDAYDLAEGTDDDEVMEQANAQFKKYHDLIAAIPDMLNALTRIADGAVMNQIEPYTHLETVLAYQELARRTIAKLA